MGYKRKIVDKLLRNMIGKVNFQDFWRRLFELSMRGMNIGEGGECSNSGELYALKYVLQNIIPESGGVVFDVGANVGVYALDLYENSKDMNIENIQIHCFEPAKATFQRLSDNCSAIYGIKLNNMGISDSKVESTLYYDEETSGMASLFDRQLEYYGVELYKKEQVTLDTIDNYCEEQKIDHISFLKMDIEGNELNALKGAESMIRGGKIDAIQFEFGGCNIDSRVFFRDFWNLLHNEFKIHRVTKDGLWEIKQYNEWLEIFSCTNYLCIKV